MVTLHPGFPVLAQGDALSQSRTDLNDAIEHVLIQTLSATGNIDPTAGHYIFLDCSGGNRTFSLPDPTVSNLDQDIRLHFKRIDGTGNTCTIDTIGSSNIDGAASVTLASQYNRTTLYSNAVQWWIEEAG